MCAAAKSGTRRPPIDTTLRFDDADLVATQFLGIIANYVFWPRMLLLDWDPEPSDVARAVDEAVATLVARYAVS